MTRRDYIAHLETLRRDVCAIIAFDAAMVADNGTLTEPTPLEEERAKKTHKMMEDLAVRLYEDGAISSRVQTERSGIPEQSEMNFGKKKGGK